MREVRPGDPGPEQAARAHAQRIVGGDARAREDLGREAEVTPPDLVDRLLAHRFASFELVAHARIGAHHIFKTKFVGPTTLVVQARWAATAAGGHWCIREAEVARVDAGRADGLAPASGPGEV